MNGMKGIGLFTELLITLKRKYLNDCSLGK